MTGAIDSFLLYVFLRRLATPFSATPAFKLGLIDAAGRRLRSPVTPEDREADGPVDRLFLNLKRLLGSSSGGLSVMSSIAAASLLLREQTQAEKWNADLPALIEAYRLEVLTATISEDLKRIVQSIHEDLGAAPANSVGGGQIASVGIGPQGDPPGIPGRTVLARRQHPLKRKPMEVQQSSKGTTR